MVSTIYFNGLKMYTELHDTPNGLNKWFAGGKWFLGKYVKIRNRFLSEALLVQHIIVLVAKSLRGVGPVLINCRLSVSV